MKRKIFAYVLAIICWFLSLWFWNWFVSAQRAVDGPTDTECHWIKLNTKVPFIWNCISTSPEDKDAVKPQEAFPTFTQALIKIGMSVILVVCFILIIVGWIMIASNNKIWKWKDLIIKVARVIALLWLSWVILKLINPTFFW